MKTWVVTIKEGPFSSSYCVDANTRDEAIDWFWDHWELGDMPTKVVSCVRWHPVHDDVQRLGVN